MKFEKLSLDKFSSNAMSNDSMFKVVGGVNTKYTVLTGPDAGGTGSDTRDGLDTELTSGPLSGDSDVIIGVVGQQ